ncbi:MAG TPA: hypothetical protein VFQ23_18870 [Anaerolineales bacterium]|nr:hypothetical protein [Anaerolineales bacterium]
MRFQKAKMGTDSFLTFSGFEHFLVYWQATFPNYTLQAGLIIGNGVY